MAAMHQRKVVTRQLTQTLAPLMVLAAAEARCRELWAEVLTFYLLYGAKDDENAGGGEGLNNGGEGTRERYYHSTDHEGSTDVITDSSGNIVWDGEYEAFGAVVRSNGNIRFDASYTGKEFDTDTGLYYFNARWYDPELGRFITEDPARDRENWFAYVGNNPMSKYDSNGLDGIPVAPNVSGIGIGAAEGADVLGPLGAVFMMGKGAWDLGANLRGLYELAKQAATDERVTKAGLAENAAKDAAAAGKTPLATAAGSGGDKGPPIIPGNVAASPDEPLKPGKYPITRPDGSQAEIHSGHPHYDPKTGEHEDPHTHEIKARDPRDPNYDKGPFKSTDAHKTTPEEKKLLQ